MTIRLLLSAIVVLAIAAPVLAEQPAASCQEQLLVKHSHDQLITQKRAEVEDQLAQVAARAQVMQARIQQLEKEQVTLKAKIAELTPATPAEPGAGDARE